MDLNAIICHRVCFICLTRSLSGVCVDGPNACFTFGVLVCFFLCVCFFFNQCVTRCFSVAITLLHCYSIKVNKRSIDLMRTVVSCESPKSLLEMDAEKRKNINVCVCVMLCYGARNCKSIIM